MKLSPQEVSRLPVGSIIHAEYRFWMVMDHGVILPVEVLPERATGYFPTDGMNPGRVATEFSLVSRGNGEPLTHGTAQSKASAWMGSRQVQNPAGKAYTR